MINEVLSIGIVVSIIISVVFMIYPFYYIVAKIILHNNKEKVNKYYRKLTKYYIIIGIPTSLIAYIIGINGGLNSIETYILIFSIGIGIYMIQIGADSDISTFP